MKVAHIKAVLDFHCVGAFAGSETACLCDNRWRSNSDYRQHVAEALAAFEAAAELRPCFTKGGAA